MQKVFICAPIVVEGFFIPSFFGGVIGLIIACKNAKLKKKIAHCRQAEKILRKSQFELKTRNRINEIFLTYPNEEIYGEVLHIVLEVLKSKCGIFGYINMDGSWICPAIIGNINKNCMIHEKSNLSPRERCPGIWDRAMVEKGTFFSNEPFDLPDGHLRITRAIAVPVIYRDQLIGNLLVGNKETDYDENDEKLMQYISNKIAPVLHSRLKIEEHEKQRLKLSEQLYQSQKVEAIGRLAGGVAHDLNNLLAPVMGYSDLLIADNKVNDSQRKKLKQIRKGCKGARELVQQLLAFGRKQTLEYKPTSINAVLGGFENLLRKTIRENVELHIILAPDIKTIMADIGQIEQVVMNLSVNAADAIPEAGRIIIETAMAKVDGNHDEARPGLEAGDYVLLTVSDTGCGMSEEIRSKIFDPFYSTKGDKGTGLGLATVHGIVIQHNGNIFVHSEPGKGTTFDVYLPVSNNEYIDKQIVQTHRYDNLTGSETILLVEDNEDVRETVGCILESHGYTILPAENGAHAIQLTAEHEERVDLLITDVIMPDMLGKQLYDELVNRYHMLKVIYMSGYTDKFIAHQGVLDHGVHFIQKPFTSCAIASMVREAIDR